MKYLFLFLFLIATALLSSCEADESNDLNNANSNGKAGSLARFTVVGDKLYTVDNNQMRVFDVAQYDNPTFEQTVSLIEGVETVFPYGNYLYFGTQTGMFIYDISNPSSPRYVSFYEHIQACDPVVVQGNYAYVTVRSGTVCRTTTNINELHIINVSNPENPREELVYPLENPYGLGIDGNFLFICDGTAGLKVFNIAFAPEQIELIHHFPNVNAYDVIPDNNRLFMIAKEGLYQYLYSPAGTMELLSSIPVEQD